LDRCGHPARRLADHVGPVVVMAAVFSSPYAARIAARPDIQEEILFLGRPERGRGPLHLRQVRPLAAVLNWDQQRRLWRKLRPG